MIQFIKPLFILPQKAIFDFQWATPIGTSYRDVIFALC